MKINKFMKGATIAAAALVLSSCASDYLDTPYHGVIFADDVCKTTSSAHEALLGVCGYGMVTPWGSDIFPAQAFSQGETCIAQYLGEVPSNDNYVNFIYDAAPSWTIFYNQEDGALTNGGYVWEYTAWTYCYANIAQLNEIIAGIDGAQGDDGERAFTKAQAHALRAHFYWRLLSIYGPRWEDSKGGTVKCIIERSEPSAQNDKAPSSMNEILDLCYNDLDIAVEEFGKAGSYTRKLEYEPDLNIACGIYARVAALKHDWAKCETMAEKARQGYSVPTDAEEFNGYMEFNKKDWMWGPSFDPINNWIYGNWCTFFACDGYGACQDRYTNRIDLDLYNSIPETDNRRDWWLGLDNMPGTNIKLLYNKKTVDQATGQFKQDMLIKKATTWFETRRPKLCQPSDVAYSGAGSGDKATSLVCLGAQVKFWCSGLTGDDALGQVPYMRSVEMLLYQAEAAAEQGKAGVAQKLLEELNVPRNPQYTCTKSGQELINEVRLYRRVELWGEGFSWFDFKRWNIPVQRRAWVDGDVTSGNWPAALAVTVPTKQNYGWRYGIPNDERSYNLLLTEPVPDHPDTEGEGK